MQLEMFSTQLAFDWCLLDLYHTSSFAQVHSGFHLYESLDLCHPKNERCNSLYKCTWYKKNLHKTNEQEMRFLSS